MKRLSIFIITLVLLSCSDDEPETSQNTITNIINSEGGIVSSSDSKVSINIPSNALDTDTEITIDPTTTHPMNNLGQVYDFEPNGTQFAVPATISFNYDNTDLLVAGSDANLSVAYVDSGSWVLLNSTIDESNNTISASVDHFSTFGLVYRNVIDYRGEDYLMTVAEVENLGLQDPFEPDPDHAVNFTHYGYDMSLYSPSSANQNIEIHPTLYSKNESDFSEGTFIFQDVNSATAQDVVNKTFFFDVRLVINSSVDIKVTSGTIKLMGDPGNQIFSIEFIDLSYPEEEENGVVYPAGTVNGIYTGVFQ